MSKVLSWAGRGLKLNTKEQVEELLVSLDPTIIEEIHLGGNTIGVDASEALAKFIAKAENIKIADFADIFTGRLISEIPQALTALCDALIDKKHLVELNLSDNAFGGRSVDPIVPFLTKNRHFQILKLNNNGLGPAGGEVIANAIAESAKLSKAEGKTSNLRTVICGRNRLENGSAPAWADAFAAHGTLVEVRMPQNGIWMDGITALAKGLAKCPHLEYIDLQDNTFTRDATVTGVDTWAESLTSWPKLHTLNLSDCVLASEGGDVPSLVQKLAEGSNPNLKTLSLQNNNLESAAYEILVQNIDDGLKTLKRLELQVNEGVEDDDDGHLATLRSVLKKRGGRLLATDEDEEEEEAEKDEEKDDEDAEKEEEAEKEDENADKDEAALSLGTPAEKKTETATGEFTKPAVDPADELADLLKKVEIKQ